MTIKCAICNRICDSAISEYPDYFEAHDEYIPYGKFAEDLNVVMEKYCLDCFKESSYNRAIINKRIRGDKTRGLF